MMTFMPLLICHDDPVIAELETALSKLMTPSDQQAWLIRHNATLGKDVCRVWPKWVAWLIRNPEYGFQGIADRIAAADRRCGDASSSLTVASGTFAESGTLGAMLGHRITQVFVDLFLGMVNEAQRIGYEMARNRWDQPTALKHALWSVAYAAAAAAFRDRHHHVVSVVDTAVRAVSVERSSTVHEQQRAAWARAAANALTELIEARP